SHLIFSFIGSFEFLLSKVSTFFSSSQAPHLRQPILELYQEKVDYLKDPEKVSHRMHSIPQFLLVNRDGVIVDYGSALRPSQVRQQR
ncbi:MAG: hypothetical protein K2G34_01665, partial [Bacteroides sp.]|nr:hypothetical protein [Bacteroides sp.]